MAHTSWFVGKTLRKAKQRKGRSICHESRATCNDHHETDSTSPGIGATYVDPETECDPPAPATVVTFPRHELYSTTTWTGEHTTPRFAGIFASILKSHDITKDHVESLNIEYATDQSLKELLPLAADGSSFLPAVTADQACEVTEYADPSLGFAEQQKRQQEFHSRLAELRVNNDTAYRTLARKPKNGTRGVRLAHMRGFYGGLESMSRYWECDDDKYYEAVPEDDQVGNRRRVKRIRLNNQEGLHGETAIDSCVNEAEQEGFLSMPDKILAMSPEEEATKKDVDNSPGVAVKDSCPGDTSPESQIKLRYKGRRTNTGTEMPDTFRSDMVKSFVEGIVWPFRCSVHPPRVKPLVQFGTLNVPVRQTAAVYRQAEDRTRARQGHLVGPMLTIQARAETSFAEDEGESAVHFRLDLLRELGALLQSAQERCREGRTEVKSGESKWWTTRPRFGGARHAVAKAADEIKVDEVLDPALGLAPAVPTGVRVRDSKIRSSSSAWEQLRCGSSCWDAKTTYMAIGKDPASCFDEVFMVSSLNHHICILKLTVHRCYTDYLVSGALPQSLPEDSNWSRPKLQRSAWFDMFDADQRVEVFRGVWGVMAYLTRSTEAYYRKLLVAAE